jgi:hypothetical protein
MATVAMKTKIQNFLSLHDKWLKLNILCEPLHQSFGRVPKKGLDDVRF